METTSEMAVLRSVSEFAFKKVDKELKSLRKDESKEILEILEEPISEIIEGFEEPHTDLQQKWWKMKLNAVFLLQTQEGRMGCSQPMNGLPLISYDSYFDMVKAFDWFESLVEVPCLLEISQRFKFYIKLTQHVRLETVTHLDLQLISSLIGHLIQLAVCDQPIIFEKHEIEFHQLLSTLLENILQYSELVENLNGDILSEFLNRIILLPVLYLEEPNLKFERRDHNADLFSKFYLKRNENVCKLDITKFPCDLWLKCLKFVSKSLRAKLDVDFLEAMNKRYFNVNNFEIEMESLCAEFLQIRDTIFENLSEELIQEKDRLCVLISSVFEKQQTISEREAEERKAVEKLPISCLNRIETKNPGFEDDIENLFKQSDWNQLDQEGYLDLFLKNPTVLFKDQYLYRIVEIYQHLSQQNCANEETISKLKELLISVFRNLPVILQQQFILHIYSQNVDLQLLSESEFNSQLTVIFNKFTINSTQEVIQDVMYLLLVDVIATMKGLVDAVINNSGQIDTVIQILQSLPDLCKFRHATNHPEGTLLVECIHNVISESNIETLQEKNLLKFIPAVSKNYRYQILQDKDCQESSVLNIQEFVRSCILSNLDVDALYLDTFTLPLEFTIKLFTTVLETTRDKPCDWLINLNPVVILLLISHVYDEAVQSLDEFEYFDTKMAIRQLMHRLLAAMKNPLRKHNFKIEEKHTDWFMYHIQEYDWRIKIVLHKFISSFIDDGKEAHTQYLKEAITCAIETGDLELVLQLAVINEEVTAMMLNYLHQLPATQKSLVLALSKILPYLLPTEWTRLYQLVTSIIGHFENFSLNLMLIDKLITQHLEDEYEDITAMQSFHNAVSFLIFFYPSDTLQYTLRSYTGLVQHILGKNSITKPPTGSRALFLVDLFSSISILAAVVDEYRDMLFVCLLDILAEVKKYDVVTSAIKETYQPVLYEAVEDFIKDEQMALTLSSRLDEMLLNQ